MRKKIFVAGSSGFIGGHLVRKLKAEGNYVVGADIVKPLYDEPDEFYKMDLRYASNLHLIFYEQTYFDEVYILAAMMGGMGFIGDTKKSYEIMVGSTQIIENILDAVVNQTRYSTKVFYSSSACVYNMNLQEQADSAALKEQDAYPAMPDLMYGWQKLMGEKILQAAHEQYGLDIRIARFHNIFGHEGIYDGGKEKAPAALARKIALAKDEDKVEIWGDGKQVRSFLFIEECLEGVARLMASDYKEPLNIGSNESVSIRKLAELITQISGKKIEFEFDLTKPQGVRGRCSDNAKIEEVLGWKPTRSLYSGLMQMYAWVEGQVNHSKIF